MYPYIPYCFGYLYQWWRALWGTPVKTAAQNPCISQIILFANAIQTPKCVNMIPNSSEHIHFYLIMTHSWHTYKSTVLISCNAIATADIMPSIVMYPPKINRKNYCTVQCHRKPLGPKMTYHNVLPESKTLFPRFALIFNILIERTSCARIKSFGFLLVFWSRQILCTARRSSFLVIQLSMTGKELLPMESTYAQCTVL